MKVLHGMTEIAGQGTNSVKGLQKNGINAHMAVWRKNTFGYKYDLDNFRHAVEQRVLLY